MIRRHDGQAIAGRQHKTQVNAVSPADTQATPSPRGGPSSLKGAAPGVEFPDDVDRDGSVDMPIDMAQRLVANARRVRWLLVALTLTLSMLFLLGRLSFPEAAFIFTALTITAFLSSAPTRTTSRKNMARLASKAKVKPAPPSLEQLVQAWPQAVILLDERAVIRSVNALAGDVLDIQKVGDPFSFKMRDPDVLRLVQQALTDGRVGSCTLVERVPAERRITLHIRPFIDGLSVHHVLIVVDDETDTYRAERMRSDFVANASHELRTPLASITGCIETLKGAARNDPVGQDNFLRLMEQQADRMKALIDDLLSLNRIEMQAHRRPTDCVDFVAITREAIDLVRPDAERAALELNLDLPDTATVQGDGPELRQVAINLMQNAVKYGGSGQRVDVSVGDAVEGGVRMVELRVKDDGPGIDEADLPRLTERFYRAHEQTNPLAAGTGLGLAIVKHIVARHKGRLLVESVRGEGALFSVRIPYLAPQREKAATTKNRMINQIDNLSHK
ncbi:MAG: ATP-binding protein [Pseudomonadota bacterium]